ncbi:MAG: hypothetical protein P4L73_14790 [Caulobacteraceae bacterium]|nr:hypothetical protein [Caulobacteraceae bacterium]
MKALTLAAMAASALMALAAPGLGAAQPYDHHDWGGPGPGPGPGYDRGPGDHGRPGGWDLDRRIDWMQQRINRGRADGSLDGREAWRAQRSLDGIRQDERRMRYRNGGWLNDRQRGVLQDRLDRLNDQIRWLRHNDERRPW